MFVDLNFNLTGTFPKWFHLFTITMCTTRIVGCVWCRQWVLQSSCLCRVDGFRPCKFYCNLYFFSDRIVRCRRELLQRITMFSRFVYSSHRGLLFLYFYLYSTVILVWSAAPQITLWVRPRFELGLGGLGTGTLTTRPPHLVTPPCFHVCRTLRSSCSCCGTTWRSGRATRRTTLPGAMLGTRIMLRKTQQEGQHDLTALPPSKFQL